MTTYHWFKIMPFFLRMKSRGSIDRRALKTNKQLSEARNKQATHISETRDGLHFVASHFFIVRPILVLMNLSWRLNLCLCVKPFITWIGQTIKKMASDERRPIPLLADVSCLFVPRLAELLVFSARRDVELVANIDIDVLAILHNWQSYIQLYTPSINCVSYFMSWSKPSKERCWLLK